MLKKYIQKIKKVMLVIFIISFIISLNKTYGATNEAVQSAELNEGNQWNTTVTLPKYEDNGEKIDYYIQEQTNVKGYTSSIDKFTVTNTLNEAKVITRYIDKITKKEISNRTETEGYVGLDYTTNSLEIENYTLVGNSNNVSGTMTEDDIYVDYYYLYNCDINVEHIDKSTGKVIEEENHKGLEGENLTTHSKDIPNYKLVEKPENENQKFTKEPQKVKYYYLKLGTLTINKVDNDNNTILDGVTRFEIYDEKDNKLYFMKKDDYYVVSDNKKDLDYVETQNGQVVIKDIIVGKYKIKETKAPNGYFLLSNKKEIEITNDNLNFEININNKKAFFLPLTGGNGIIATIIGVSLISIGIILVIYKKIERKEKVKNEKNIK